MIKEKYQPDEISRTLVILAKSLDTIKKRLTEMKSKGIRPNLYYCTLSQDRYKTYMEKLTRQQKLDKINGYTK